jgi:hypothetical protein
VPFVAESRVCFGSTPTAQIERRAYTCSVKRTYISATLKARRIAYSGLESWEKLEWNIVPA